MIRIMLVDDQKRELDGIQGIMDWQAMGMEVVAAVPVARDALRMFPEIKPDIVISDVIMPDMDGLNLLAEFRALSPRVKVILISCFDDFKFVSAAVNGGASGYLLKPLLAGELKKVLSRVCQEIREERAHSAPPSSPVHLPRLDEIMIRTESAQLQCSTENLLPLFEGLSLHECRLTAAAVLGQLSIMDGSAFFDWEKGLSLSGKEELFSFLSGIFGKKDSSAAPDAKENIVWTIRQNIDRNLNQEITPRILMENVFMSPGYASTLFKNAMGMTTHQYILNRRLQEAAALLLEKPDMKIYDVAQACGFSDASHLINQFQKKYRMTPAQFRLRGKNHE